MLIKNILDVESNIVDPLELNTNMTLAEGTIVGFNIKRCYIRPIGHDDNIETYGMFLHVKVEYNGITAQYDLVFDPFTNILHMPTTLYPADIRLHSNVICKSLTINWKKIKKFRKDVVKKNNPSAKRFRFPYRETSPILQLINVCNCNELVELIGSKVCLTAVTPMNIYDTDPIHLVVYSTKKLENSPARYITPMMFQIHTDNTELNSYMERYMVDHPGRCVDEYDRSSYDL